MKSSLTCAISVIPKAEDSQNVRGAKDRDMNPMIERRKFERLQTQIPLTMNLLGTATYLQPIHAEIRDVSLEGLSIELQVMLKEGSVLIPQSNEPIKLFPFLVLNKKLVELDIKIPEQDKSIKATGRVVWYDFGAKEKSFYFKAGISLEKMRVEDGEMWVTFIKNLA